MISLAIVDAPTTLPAASRIGEMVNETSMGRPSLRTREARRVLRNARFERLARDFDEVVYGRRPPRSEDVAAARSEWPRVLDEVRQ